MLQVWINGSLFARVSPETTPINLDSPLAVVSQQERLTTPSQPPLHVAMSTTFQLKKLMRIPTSSLVRSLLNCHPATVLFDAGASHSFISESYARLHNTTFCDMPTSMVIQTPGSKWQTSKISHGNEILVDRLVFLASLIALKSLDINIILGMD